MRFLLSIFLLIIVNPLFSQIDIEKNYFRSPIDFPILLSASFGELRGGHFHAGIDIKTKGVEGKKIYAIADGYVSRIKTTLNGYGNAIYIAHPNGYTSVYGHLKELAIHIDEYLKHFQYEKQSFVIDLILEENEILVKKGDVIALSGNSGSSFGPHIHFEIRETHTQKPVNPLFTGFKITDNVKPRIHSITLYPIKNKGFVNGYTQKKPVNVFKSKGGYKLAEKDSIIVSGKVGFGIHANDYHNYTHNKCGIYNLTLKVDNKIIYEHQFDKFSFANTRFINSHIDYEEYMKSKVKIHQCFLDPFNNISIYTDTLNMGIVEFNDNQRHEVEFILTDEYKNTSNLKFNVYAKERNYEEIDSTSYDSTLVMPFNQKNIFKNDEIEMYFPEYAFYDTILFQLDIIDSVEISNYRIYNIHTKFEPVHKKYKLKIKNQEIPDSLTEKTFIALIKADDKYKILKTKFADGFFSTEAREFGSYTLAIDTVPPIVISKNKTIEKLTINNRIAYNANDAISGINEFNGFINGQWVLFEYDEKNEFFWHKLDSNYQNGSFIKVEFIVSDITGNKTIFTEEFKYYTPEL